MAQKKRYDIEYDLRINIDSDNSRATDIEILQAIVDKVKYLAANRSQISSSVNFKYVHDNDDDVTEMPF